MLKYLYRKWVFKVILKLRSRNAEWASVSLLTGNLNMSQTAGQSIFNDPGITFPGNVGPRRDQPFANHGLRGNLASLNPDGVIYRKDPRSGVVAPITTLALGSDLPISQFSSTHSSSNYRRRHKLGNYANQSTTEERTGTKWRLILFR